jgi:phosphoesterase RecJ-like protein
MPLTIDNETVERFAIHLGKAQNIVIVSHMNPDGDAVGSALGAYHWLRTAFFAGETMPQISVVLPHPCPDDMRYLPGSEDIINAEENLALCEQRFAEADLIWGVDFNNASRILPLDKALAESNASKMLVDHHHNPDTTMFQTVVSVPDLSSTCELLYWLFVQMIGDSSITLPTARCLFHGINTDTGCFAYANEDPSLYEAAAALMHHPIGAADVHNRTFNNYSIKKMQILGFLLSERLKIFPEVGFSYIYINADDLAHFDGTANDLEGLVNYTLMMQPMAVGAMVKETDGKVRISFRAKGDFDVNVFAHKYFGGGGHTQASGATSPYDFDTTLKVLEENMLRDLSNHLKNKTSK